MSLGARYSAKMSRTPPFRRLYRARARKYVDVRPALLLVASLELQCRQE
jgi:hypothetical protein